ncbi:MAG: AAA family ATPase [Pirellulales bacterium]
MNTNHAEPCPFTFPAPRDVVHAQHIAGAVRLTHVQPQNIRWLWPGRIPLGRVTLLVSDPGIGKSLLTLDIAARVSTGASWPDVDNPHSAIGNPQSSDHSSFDIRHSSFVISDQSAIRNPKSAIARLRPPPHRRRRPRRYHSPTPRSARRQL